MDARDIMTSPAVTIGEDATIGEAAAVMIERNASCLPVLNSTGKLIGILTHSDFGFQRRFLRLADEAYTLMGSFVRPESVERVAREVSERLVKDVMTQPVVTLDEDASVSDVAEVMINKGVNRIPVMRNNDVVGIITRHDMVKLMLQNMLKG